jgi:hypothetical protein
MKIKTTTGEEIDTKSLNDREAEISECVQNLYDICQRYNCSMLARVVPNETKYIGAQFVMKGTQEKSNDSLMFLLGTVNKYVSDITKGEIQLIKVSPDELNGEFGQN